MEPDDGEGGGVAERRRPEEDGADHAEEGGDRGDAEAEGERRGEGGREVAAEPAQGEAEVERHGMTPAARKQADRSTEVRLMAVGRVHRPTA